MEEMILSYETIDQYRHWLLGQGKSKNTSKGYCSDLTQFLIWTQNPAVTKGEFLSLVTRWLNHYRDLIPPKTTARRLSSLRGYAAWSKCGILIEYSAPKPPRSMPHPLPGGVGDLERLVAVAKNDMQRAMIGLLGYNALRIEEGLTVTPEDFNLVEENLYVKGKGDRDRIVPLSPRAWELCMPAYLDAVMISSTTKLIRHDERYARRVITSMGKRAKLARPISSHDLRATCATVMLELHGDIRAVQEILGHKSVETTQIYTDAPMKRMRKVINIS